MVKVVDMAWVADKSLDLYCASVAKEYPTPQKVRYCSRSVSTAVFGIFDSVLESAVAEYSPRYDHVFIVVPCFPISRMTRISAVTRFICRNSDYLAELGVSSNQFQELFERFLSRKCSSEYVTKAGDKVYLLNGRGVLLHDWTDAIHKRFGSSLVDSTKDFPFDSNPGFIDTMEDDMSIFTETGEDVRFRLGEILERLA